MMLRILIEEEIRYYLSIHVKNTQKKEHILFLLTIFMWVQAACLKNLKSRKAPSQLSFLYSQGMSSSSLSNAKTKKILKRNIKKGSKQQIGSISKNNSDYVPKTPIKTHSINIDDELTAKRKFPKPLQDHLSKSLDFYQSSNPYILGQINSVTFYNGRFYDLLKLKKDSFQLKKQIKCGCTKSKCQAKYCQCFARGIGCSVMCGCVDCKNQVGSQTRIKQSIDRLCKCSKSGCVKKYCECYQRGDACSSKCKCTNCHNNGGCQSHKDS